MALFPILGRIFIRFILGNIYFAYIQRSIAVEVGGFRQIGAVRVPVETVKINIKIVVLICGVLIKHILGGDHHIRHSFPDAVTHGAEKFTEIFPRGAVRVIAVHSELVVIHLAYAVFNRQVADYNHVLIIFYNIVANRFYKVIHISFARFVLIVKLQVAVANILFGQTIPPVAIVEPCMGLEGKHYF